MSKIFRKYGEICATHPWEVIVVVITLTIILLTLDLRTLLVVKKPPQCDDGVGGCLDEQQFHAADMILMTLIRCVAILYSYQQFRNLQKLGSKYILGIAGLFVVVSSFVFTTTLLNILNIDIIVLKDGIFIFLLLIDLSKARTLAQFALTASETKDISGEIATGISVLGPSLTLDTFVEILVISVGTLSGVDRLETLSYFTCLSAIVNYIIFMTFYPACLGLILEMAKISNFYGTKQPMVRKKLLEENNKSNLAGQRIKLIMSFGLLAVHLQSWIINNINDFDSNNNSNKNNNDDNNNNNTDINNKDLQNYCSEDKSFYGLNMKQFMSGAEKILILIFLLTLVKRIHLIINDYLNNEHQELMMLRELFALNQQENQQNKPSIKLLLKDAETQTDYLKTLEYDDNVNNDDINDRDTDVSRSLQNCLEIYRSVDGALDLSDKEIIMLADTKHIPAYHLEKAVQNPERGVRIRRKLIGKQLNHPDALFLNLPYKNYDYTKVMGACCENVLGYVPVPLGVAGPLLLDGKFYFIPMATTEGCLVASANRGCRALEKTGIKSIIRADGMSRAPTVQFPTIIEADELSEWLKMEENFEKIKQEFDSTSRYAKLTELSTHMVGRKLYIRFIAKTGDAMGMNMISKGCEKVLIYLKNKFNKMEIISLSGNVCTDKKPSAINWIKGRGKSVVCEAIVPANIIQTVLKTSTEALVKLNIAKNFIGSAIAGSIGGNNAQAANMVTAIFIATGQDPAQNIASSNCMTIMEPCGDDDKDLRISCTMPSIEVGTVGGGTVLPAQTACLEMLGVKGAHLDKPGENAQQLAKIVCGSVLACELSLMAALASGNLVTSHLKYNRTFIENAVPSTTNNNRLPEDLINNMSCQS